MHIHIFCFVRYSPKHTQIFINSVLFVFRHLWRRLRITFLKKTKLVCLHVFTFICIQLLQAVEQDFPTFQAGHLLRMVWRSTCRDLKLDCHRISMLVNIFSFFLLRLPRHYVLKRLKVLIWKDYLLLFHLHAGWEAPKSQMWQLTAKQCCNNKLWIKLKTHIKQKWKKKLERWCNLLF